MDTLLKNAALSLKVGIEDYQSPQPERVLSGVRNVTAGVLLLLKEKLRLMSPIDTNEVLLRERTQPFVDDAGNVTFKGIGKNTVGVGKIKERFKTLGIHIDWDRLDNIVRIRNELEHYYTGEPEGRLRELVADTFLLVRDFLTTQLSVQPTDILDADTWSTMLNWAEVYEKELNDCRCAVDEIKWPRAELRALAEHFRCTSCYSELLKPTDASEQYIQELSFSCSSCGTLNHYQDIVEEGVAELLGGDAYLALTDGGDVPYVSCPECFKNTYLIEADFCACCDYSRTFTKCAICHAELSADEQQHRGLCSYHAWVAEKEADT